MELFGIGPAELLLVFVLALIFIGPGKMPEVAASLGKMLREFRAASAELTDALNAEIAEVERRKTSEAIAENGNGHVEADAAQAEIVAQGPVDTPTAVEFTSPETINYQYEPPVEPEVAPPSATIDDVLAAIVKQEEEEAARREAEEAARVAAIALERAIQNGVGPLPEPLLAPSTDMPLAVVNPTESPTADPTPAEKTPLGAIETDAAEPSAELAEEPVDAPPSADSGELPEAAPAEADTTRADARSESLETSGAGQAEVL